jgi:ribosome biogenesis protein Nip4
LGCLLCAQAYAQHTTEFLFSETAPESIRKTMQTNAEAVFAEINRACDQNKAGLLLSPANVTDEASSRIHNQWANSHFYCTKTSINTRVLKSSNGYQVRNIPVCIEKGNKPEDKYQDMVIEFDKKGKISDLTIALSQHQYAKIMENSNEVTNARQRMMVIEFVENLRTAYNRRDIGFIDTVYNDNALIITGKVVRDKTSKNSDTAIPALTPIAHTPVQIEYNVQNKKTYIENLKRIFKANSYINIKFNEVVVTQHEGDPNIYGVILKQNWNSKPTKDSPKGYQDEGWLFLMIDFEKEEEPSIWVRTWQPCTNPYTGQPIRYNTEDIFGLGNFPVR